MTSLPLLDLGPLDPTDSRAVDALYGLPPALSDRTPRTREALECELSASPDRPPRVLVQAPSSVFESYVPPRQVDDAAPRRQLEVLASRCYPCDREIILRRVAGIEQRRIGQRLGLARQTVTDAERSARSRMRIAAELPDHQPGALERELVDAGASDEHACVMAAAYWLPSPALLSLVLGISRQAVRRRCRGAIRHVPRTHPASLVVLQWPVRHAGWRHGEMVADHCRGGPAGWERVRRQLDLQDGDVDASIDHLRATSGRGGV
jgi:hypothetical protein